jgi:hypothetical protein
MAMSRRRTLTSKTVTLSNMPIVAGSSARQRSCFVISPIGAEDSEERKHADAVFKYIIEPATGECGLFPHRSDHLSHPGRISDEMYARILNDDLCIALLTYRNPNVYYELAIAQSAARPVIMLLQRDQEAPFDIKDFRFIAYDFLPERLIKEKRYVEQLIQHIRAIQETGWKVACPIPGMGDAWESNREASYKVYGQLLMAVTSGSFPQSIINEAEQYLCFAGITLGALHLLAGFETMIKEAIARGCEVEAFIMDEDNPALPQMLMDPSHLQEVRQRISQSWTRWEAMVTRCGHKLSAHKVRMGMLFQQATLNERRLLCAPYMTSRAPNEAPAIATIASSPIYKAIRHELRVLKERNSVGGGAL